jgi:IS5 family transposase
MPRDAFYGDRLVSMIDMRQPLAMPVMRLPRAEIDASSAEVHALKDRSGRAIHDIRLFGPFAQFIGAGLSNAGRIRLPIRLAIARRYFKHAFNLSSEEPCVRRIESVVWWCFSGMAYGESRPPCDVTQIECFCHLLGGASVEQLLKPTIEASVSLGVVEKSMCKTFKSGTTVQRDATASPTEDRIRRIVRHTVARAARQCGSALKQTFAKEGTTLRRKAGGFTPAEQFRRLRRTVKHQRTIRRRSCAIYSARWNRFRRTLPGMNPRHWLCRN